MENLKDKRLIVAGLVGFIAPKILQLFTTTIYQRLQRHQDSKRIYVGIQLGGTNYNIAFGNPQFDRNGKLINFKLTFHEGGRTSDNFQNTLNQICNKIKKSLGEKEKIHFVGITSFGPLELKKQLINYGNITSTPKQGWKNVPLLKYLRDNLGVQRIQIQTDVNAAAYAEFKLGNHLVKQSLAYVTVGTGVGVGIVAHGKTIHGLTHPQGGHILVNRHPEQYNQFEGVCPYHKCCLQGMVANRSISKRTGQDYVRLNELEDSQKIWEIIGYYLAQLCLNITLTVSPEVIIIGGGIMNRKILFKYIRKDFLKLLSQPQNIDKYIISPNLGGQVGVKGGLLLKYL